MQTCFQALYEPMMTLSWPINSVSVYDLESYGAYKKVDSHSAADVPALHIPEDSTYQDESPYQIGMLWADNDSNLPKNSSAAFEQPMLLKCHIEKILI